MARFVTIAALSLLLVGCKAMSPSAGIGGNSDHMRGSAGIGIPL